MGLFCKAHSVAPNETIAEVERAQNVARHSNHAFHLNVF